VILAVEDAISESVGRKLIAAIRPDLSVSVVLGRQGKGYLQSRARELNRSATGLRVVVITDQDVAVDCPPSLLENWFGTRTPRALVRVATMEIESWVLADRFRIAAMLGVAAARLPLQLDDVPDPKELLVNTARRSRYSSVRRELVPSAGSTARVGPAYNLRIAHFVETAWDPKRAAPASASLERAIDRLTRWD
jgi:hypothetical protein